MKKKLLIFDLDGTIADTIYSIRDAVNLTLAEYGMAERSYEEIRCSIGNGARELIRLSLPECKRNDATLVDRVFADYDKTYAKTYANVGGCYDGMSEALHVLHQRGYVLTVLSNKQDTYTKKIIAHLFPDGIFSFIQGQTQAPRKPDPTVPLEIAEKFGASPCECAFIGDSDVDVRTAKNAGMTAIACPWGYRPRETLTDADVMLEYPLQLIEIFE